LKKFSFPAEQPEFGAVALSIRKFKSAGSVRHTSTKFFGWKKTSVKIFFCLHYSEREARSLSSTEFVNAAWLVQVELRSHSMEDLCPNSSFRLERESVAWGTCSCLTAHVRIARERPLLSRVPLRKHLRDIICQSRRCR